MTQTYAQPGRRRSLAPFVVAAAVVAVTGVIALVTGTTETPVAGKAVPHQADLLNVTTDLTKAYAACGATGTLADDEHTLLVDMKGEDYGSGEATLEGTRCVLTELDVPQSVIGQMSSTRALDGMQTATWDDYSVSWTYHPDDGLDLIITESD